MKNHHDQPIDMQRALQDPQQVFSGPEDVLAHSTLDKADKIKILRHWYYDVSDVEVAEEEGMPPKNDEDILTRILKTLEELGADPEHPDAHPPTKQGNI